MKRPNLEQLIETEEKRLEESPLRAALSVMVWLTNKHYGFTRVTGQELASACLVGCFNADLGWKLYWLIHKAYAKLYGKAYIGESDEDMGKYSIELLKLVLKGIISEIS